MTRYFVPDWIQGGVLEAELLHADLAVYHVRYLEGTRLAGVEDDVPACDIFLTAAEAAEVVGCEADDGRGSARSAGVALEGQQDQGAHAQR